MTRLLSRLFSYRQPKFVCAWASTFAGPLPLCPPPFVADLLAANFDVLVSSSLIGQKYRDGEHLLGRPSQTATAGDSDSIVACRWWSRSLASNVGSIKAGQTSYLHQETRHFARSCLVWIRSLRFTPDDPITPKPSSGGAP